MIPSATRTITGVALSSALIISMMAFVQRASGPAPYRDLNKNQKMDVYEDPSQSVEKRVEDLLRQMTLEEKAGMMFITGSRINDDGSLDDKPGKGMFAFAP